MQRWRQAGVEGDCRRITGLSLAIGLGLITCFFGCTPISIAPVCPNSLRVGESGPVVSNVANPKGLATYQWDAIPSDAGTFENPNVPETRFTPSIEGDIVLRLTASDGLFQVISECVTSVTGAVGASVSLLADPAAALVGEVVTLTCSSDGTFDLTVFAITQTEGVAVDLQQVSQSVATFTPSEIGDVTFRCIGETSRGAQTDPATATITVNQSLPDPDPNPPGDGDAGAGSDGTGDTGLPPRGGGRGARG